MAAKNPRGNEMEEDESPFFPFLPPGWSLYFILCVENLSVDAEDDEIRGEEKIPEDMTLNDGAPNTNSKRN